MKQNILFLLFVSIIPTFALAEQPVVGRQAASKYFKKDTSEERTPAAEGAGGGHYLALHLGKFMSSQAWEWGQRGKVDDVGNMSIGLTYKLSEWQGLADFDLRADFNTYDIAGKTPLKMSFLPLIMFPEAGSQFPMYFGIGAGPGVFFTQLEDESPLTIDYQLLLGVRFFDVVDNGGFFIETGLKNHLQLTTSGQFNGVFLTAGALFTF